MSQETIAAAGGPPDLLEAIHAGAQVVVAGADGRSLPEPLVEVLREAAGLLASGHRVTVLSDDTVLTSQEAAVILGVSRPTMTKILDESRIPSSRPGSHRRVRLTDVVAYREASNRRGRDGLDALAALQSEDDPADFGPPRD